MLFRSNLPAEEKEHDVLATLWARRKVADLMANDFDAMQRGSGKAETQSEITRLGLDYRLMTQYTSFIAVEDKIVNTNGKPQVIAVPVEMPEGVSYDGVYGRDKAEAFAPSPMSPVPMGAGPMAKMRRMMPSVGTVQPPTQREEVRAAKVDLKQPEPRQISKLHPDLLKLGSTETVEVEVWLDQPITAELLAKLTKAGLQVVGKPATGGALVKGRIKVAHLSQLEALTEVRLINPAQK